MSAFRAEIDGEAFKLFQRELKKIEPALAKELKKELKAIVNTHVIPDAKSNASWSSRIPGAIKPQALAKGIGVRVARKRAPHAAAFEGMQPRGMKAEFRHPVFGDREVWVSQPTRPFLLPAIDANQQEAADAARDAVEAAAKRAAGFK